jgi:hypothetical protein
MKCRPLPLLALLLVASFLPSQAIVEKPRLTLGVSTWRPVQPGEMSLFGALKDLSQTVQSDDLLAQRGVIRSVNFEYGRMRFERDYFNTYKGVLLGSFWEGRLSLGLYQHRPRNRFGPQRGGTRYELLLRWDLNQRN